MAGLVPAYSILIGLGFWESWEGTRHSPTASNVDSVVAGLVPAYRFQPDWGLGGYKTLPYGKDGRRGVLPRGLGARPPVLLSPPPVTEKQPFVTKKKPLVTK